MMSPQAMQDAVIRTGTNPHHVHAGTLSRQARRGTLHPVRRGSFVTTELWSSLHDDDRHLLLIRETAPELTPSRVVSHDSAAALHGLPTLGRLPEKVEVTVPRNGGGITSRHIKYHTSFIAPQSVMVDGVACTSVARTVLDLARSGRTESAVMAGDNALARGLTSLEEMTALLEEERHLRGYGRARRLLALLDARSESPAESLTRLRLVQVGTPTPLLQVELRDADGLIGRVDMLIPQLGVVVEFDGMGKYGIGRAALDVDTRRAVLAEKRREDRLRALGYRVIRFQWPDVVQIGRFRALCIRYGLISPAPPR